MSRAVAPKIRLDAAALATTSPILPHQQAAWNWLQEELTAPQVAEFAELFRAAPAVKEPLLPKATNPLTGVPYFSQINASDGPEGWRQCQTSSIAMCLSYLKVPGINDDIDYLRIVRKHGDTTEQTTHTAALKELGVKARFVTNASPSQVQAEIKAGLPVAMGVLHRGFVNSPKGGHWIACYGFDMFNYIVNDPYGELNVLSGQWVRTGGASGRGLRYSYRNLNPRWLAEGPASGWAWLFS
jgi:hypothetical protein